MVSKLYSLWDNASLSSPASKAAPTAEVRLGRGSCSLFLPGIFRHTRLYGPEPCSYHACLLGLAGLFTSVVKDLLEGGAMGSVYRAQPAAISPQFQVLLLSCGNPRWLPQLSMTFPCNFLHSHSSIMPDVETCAWGPGWVLRYAAEKTKSFC